LCAKPIQLGDTIVHAWPHREHAGRIVTDRLPVKQIWKRRRQWRRATPAGCGDAVSHMSTLDPDTVITMCCGIVNLSLVLKCEPALEGDLAVGLAEEFLEIVALAVGRCVHRIDHDGPHGRDRTLPTLRGRLIGTM